MSGGKTPDNLNRKEICTMTFLRNLAKNKKGSAFIETLMVYIAVAAIGLIVVGILWKTVNDAAEGSSYQDEIVKA